MYMRIWLSEYVLWEPFLSPKFSFADSGLSMLTLSGRRDILVARMRPYDPLDFSQRLDFEKFRETIKHLVSLKNENIITDDELEGLIFLLTTAMIETEVERRLSNALEERLSTKRILELLR